MNVRERLKQEAVVTHVHEVGLGRETWREKVMENDGRLANRVMVGQVAGRRGRPRQGGMNFEDCTASY